ncbi:hypothetical protein ACROYT_G006980 [Oculina patagonica]
MTKIHKNVDLPDTTCKLECHTSSAQTSVNIWSCPQFPQLTRKVKGRFQGLSCRCIMLPAFLVYSTNNMGIIANVLQIFPVFVPGIPRSCSTTFCWEKQTGRKEADFIKLLLVNFL